MQRATLTGPVGPPAPSVSTSPTLPPIPTARVAPSWTSLARTTQGRPILATESGTGPLRIYLIGGIHGDETEGRTALESLKDQLASSSLATLRIIRDMNPDGTIAHRRTNARGRDLNRNWPAANFTPSTNRGPSPLSERESAAIHKDLLAFNPDIVIVLHSIASGPFVNYDGPAATLADTFVKAAKSTDPHWKVQPEMGYRTPGSLGSYLGIDRNLPILTIEFKRGQDEASATAALEKGLAAIVQTPRKPS